MSEPRVSRRRMLSLLAASPIWSRPNFILPLTAGVSLFAYSPKVSAAYVQIAMAAASVASNMMASSQRGDSGIAATLQATLQYQRVMSEQLSSIQSGVAEVLRAVQSLDIAFQQRLRANRASDLIAGVSAQVSNFKDEYARSVSGGFLTLEDWTKNPLTRERLLAIDFHLNTAVSLLKVEDFYGPLAALQLPTAMFTALAVRTALGDTDAAIRVLAQGYLDRFAICSDAGHQGSAAAEAKAAMTRFAEAGKALRALDVPLNEKGELISTALINAKRVVACSYVETEPPGDCRSDCSSTSAQWSLYEVTASLRRDPLQVATGEQATILPLSIEGGELRNVDNQFRHSKKGVGQTPFPGIAEAHLSPEVRANNFRSCGDRKRADQKAQEALAAETSRMQKIRPTVDTYNQEMANVALCSSSLVALGVARQSVIKAFRSA